MSVAHYQCATDLNAHLYCCIYIIFRLLSSFWTHQHEHTLVEQMRQTDIQGGKEYTDGREAHDTRMLSAPCTLPTHLLFFPAEGKLGAAGTGPVWRHPEVMSDVETSEAVRHRGEEIVAGYGFAAGRALQAGFHYELP